MQDWTPASLCEGKPARRVWKTHSQSHQVPWKGGVNQGVPKGARIIVVTRNPKDVAVSLYHHAKDVDVFNYEKGDWSHFVDHLFANGLVESGDFWFCLQNPNPRSYAAVFTFLTFYFRGWHGGWLQAAKSLSSSEIMFCSFEDMLEEPAKIILLLADFCGINTSPHIIDEIVQATTHSSMKAQFAAVDAEKLKKGMRVKKNHIRKGKKGGWRETFTVAQNDKFDRLHRKRCSKYEIPAGFWDFGTALESPKIPLVQPE